MDLGSTILSEGSLPMPPPLIVSPLSVLLVLLLVVLVGMTRAAVRWSDCSKPG
jgi:hypothetical protein